MMSGLAGSFVGGMASGVGMSLANRAVDAVLGPREVSVTHASAPAPASAPAASAAGAGECGQLEELLRVCVADCAPYAEALARCRA